MDDVRSGRYNGGFAMAKKLTPEEYTSAPMDPVAPFSAPVCSHMNGDHMDDMKASSCFLSINICMCRTAAYHRCRRCC